MFVKVRLKTFSWHVPNYVIQPVTQSRIGKALILLGKRSWGWEPQRGDAVTHKTKIGNDVKAFKTFPCSDLTLLN